MSDPVAEAALERIERGPSGAQIGAFFDLDGTLVAGYTGSAFYGHLLRSARIGPSGLARTAAFVADGMLGGDRARLATYGMASLRGTREADLVELGQRLFKERIGATIRPQARELVRAHQSRGHTVVIASSATHFQADPVALDLGVEHVLCSEVDTEDGTLTGRFAEMLWGEAKARAARALARQLGIDRRQSYGYANGGEDVPLLASVGCPEAVNPERTLERVARLQHWPVLKLADPPGTDARGLAGMLAALGALNLGLAAGLTVGELRGDRRLGSDLACALAFDSFLAVAGVRLNVTGAQNLWARRPAVFVVNHQSGLDAIIVGALLRRRFSGLGKREAQYSPPTFLLGRALDAVFIDRSDPAAAREQLPGLVERLRDGVSVFVAPEGTRSPTPVLQRFKTGAFRVAIEAGVPVVPIVLRNAYELMPGTAKGIRPGSVDVAVLEPIPTDAWTTAAIRAHTDAVRHRFVETLDDWPDG
jgi:putative phosphoserine phosphatase / 1-acylglycerol-3-phosphate O-acyltransferase